jgi:hypothetical protein
VSPVDLARRAGAGSGGREASRLRSQAPEDGPELRRETRPDRQGLALPRGHGEELLFGQDVIVIAERLGAVDHPQAVMGQPLPQLEVLVVPDALLEAPASIEERSLDGDVAGEEGAPVQLGSQAA